MPSYGTDPASRLAELQEEFTRFPGAAPGGTGLTGLGKHDAQGYSRLLERQQEYMNLQRQAAGQGPMNVRWGGVMPSQTGISPATGENNADAFGMAANIGGDTMDKFRGQFNDPNKYAAALRGLTGVRPFNPPRFA